MQNDLLHAKYSEHAIVVLQDREWLAILYILYYTCTTLYYTQY